MSTLLNTNSEPLILEKPLNPDFSCCIITADWNPEVTNALRDGARQTLLDAGVAEKNVELIAVPGTVELVNAAALQLRLHRHEAVIVIGCVIRGDTPHFDYVCQQAAQGVAILNAKGETPVIFGVLTVENLQQALDRAGGKLGNKGSEAAAAALSMANMHTRAGD